MNTIFLIIFATIIVSLNANAQNQGLTVLEYVPAPGQFINTMPEATEDDTPETMAQKCTEALQDDFPVCLGAFGGYITFCLGHPVVNIKGEYDLRMKGNSYAGNSEPGIVMVSQDTNGNGLPDDEWYELSGSADVDSIGKVIYDYEITYQRAEMQDIPWTDNQGESGTLNRVNAHKQEYFPLWIKENTLTFKGTRLPNNACDISGKGSYYVLDALRYGYVDNLANNDAEGNSFNIDWAVNKDRQPVQLTHIDFIRIYTAMNQQCGWIGETSTEFGGAEDLHLQESLDFAAEIMEVRPSKSKVQTSIHSLDGKRLNSPQKGMNIIKYSDGTTHKIIIK